MRLIKQTVLYFKEGNADKVYEIDLCDTGNDQYVVNFRYGRRGSTLKEGSKTPVPVSLQAAEKIFDAVAAEKMNKGYTSSESGQTPAPRASTFSLPAYTGPGTDWMSLPAGRTKSILKRLQQAAEGKTAPKRTPWKISRVIWKAGEYKIKEAVPFIIQLFGKGDTLHQYSCTWALVRCGHETGIETLQAIYKDHPSPLVSRIAGAGLMTMLSGTLLEQHGANYLRTLPAGVKAAIEANQATGLEDLLTDKITQQQSQYSWLESIYILSLDKRWIRPFVKRLLLQAPFHPNYFQHIRTIYKLAELLDDFEFTGMLACRLEREQEMFEHHVPVNSKDQKIYLPAVDEYINPRKELLKKNSRLAYSQKTRWYLHRRVRRRLAMLGNTENTDYVKLATGILIGYNRKLDFREAWAKHDSIWSGGRYTTVETHYPQNATAVLMHQLLSGDHPGLELEGGVLWRLRSEVETRFAAQRAATANNGGGGILKKLLGLFNKKKDTNTPLPAAVPAAVAPSGQSTANENGTPYLHLWNKLPQSFVQLLVDAEMDEVHEFAEGALTIHPSYSEIKEKLDTPVYKRLLLSPFPIPATFGYKLVTEKYATLLPPWELVIALLNSQHVPAREKGMEWTLSNQPAYFLQSDFIKDLLFVQHGEIRQWARNLIGQSHINSELRKAVAGKAIAEMMTATAIDENTEGRIHGAGDGLLALFGPELQEIPLTMIADLLLHRYPPVLLFGLKLLKANQRYVNPGTLSKSLLIGLLQHDYAPVREAGVSLLADIDISVLLKYQDEMIAACVSVYQNVRQGMAPVMARLAQQDKTVGDKAAALLMPYLLRKETSEGLHEDVSRLLCQELSGHLQNANKETALNLLYGNYAAAQNVGVVILEKYTHPDQLTMPQVIALGGHENLTVRSWSWQFYGQQSARIRYEKEVAIKLLESKWQDTRQFAMQYFREQFVAADWSPEILIALADSVKPDVEAFGRELITKFFDGEHGLQYLLQLSQHPSEKMQLFATNYLERFASDDVARIESLEFYFRSVLTRVNKGRIAKNRIYQFLLTEGRKSEEAAKTVCTILSDISATGAIGDKATCIDVLLQLRSLYEVETPLQVKPVETRMASNNINTLL
ncbi:WGR domain-containing protein [Paraflavitalea soli]|uniref:WGR domain-containing protein n=1 Tax=Paraflavitalea soli TaxID=2315862 RepID=A0A3B7MS67_9BACT|nr:WGR domain-containing protein [Paraflavitalea soli]AXY74465.1 WGR domain-containing protein [Paraflavitalea soli]